MSSLGCEDFRGHGVVHEADVRNRKEKITGPIRFQDHAVSDNVYAGNAMSRRLFYQYGVLLPQSRSGKWTS